VAIIARSITKGITIKTEGRLLSECEVSDTVMDEVESELDVTVPALIS
jgi:hypothetical protein